MTNPVDEWYENIPDIDRKEMGKAIFEALAPVCRKYGYDKRGGKRIYICDNIFVTLYDSEYDGGQLNFEGSASFDTLYADGTLQD